MAVKKLSEGDVSFFKKKRSRNTYKVYVYNKNNLPYKDLYRIVKNYGLSLELPGYWQPGYSDNPSDIILTFTPNEIDNLSKAFSEINDNYSPEDIKDIAKNQGIFSESLKEGYSDGTVSTSEIMDAINSLEELVEMMDDAGVDSIHASSSTYGLGQHFIGFPGGFINYNDVYSYVGEDEDEEYYEESLKESDSPRIISDKEVDSLAKKISKDAVLDNKDAGQFFYNSSISHDEFVRKIKSLGFVDAHSPTEEMFVDKNDEFQVCYYSDSDYVDEEDSEGVTGFDIYIDDLQGE